MPTIGWRYSEGIKEVISEGSAYMYARVFFHPKPESEIQP